jgi:hypothetical protein
VKASTSRKPKYFGEQRPRLAYDPFGMASGPAVDGRGSYRAVLRRLLHRRRHHRRPATNGSFREWIEGVARLRQLQPPHDVPRHQWRQFVEDCLSFMASEQLADRAAQLGWDGMALFGCRRNYPLSYLGKAGLLWHVNGGRIIELHRDWAVIDRPVNRSQRVFYRRDVDEVKAALPWSRW